MNGRQPNRRMLSNTVSPQMRVEFLDADDQVVGPHEAARGRKWQIRAATLVLVTAASAVWITTRNGDMAPSTTAPPHPVHTIASRSPTARHITYPMSAHLPGTITRAITRALPGISISGATVRVAGTNANRPSWVAGEFEGNYRELIIEVQIVPGISSTDAALQTLTTGASDTYMIHNRSRSALRRVTITVIAPHIARCPTARLQRMANTLSRLPNL